MRVAVISIYSFPEGMAASNRIIAYSRGLVANDVDVQLICPEPNCSYSQEKEQSVGKVKGIEYIYTSGRYKSRIKLFRAISYLSGFRFLYGAIKTWIYIRKHSFDSILISNDAPIFLLVYSFLCRKYAKNIFFVFDEYPTPIRHKLKTDIPNWKKKFYRRILPLFDGYISISKKLEEYYCSFVKKPTFLMPIIVDTEKFRRVHSLNSNSSIIYMGNMELSKDNVFIIIEAFQKIYDKYPNIELHLYGAPNSDVKNKVTSFIKEKQLENRVKVYGRIASSQVPEFLSKARILVSSQPNTQRASGGFPTKLGEYLAMGIPTLITNVGENSVYVQPNIECFFAEPDNIESYARQLDNILSDYSNACKVAENGNQLVLKKYSYLAVGENFRTFLQSINQL